MLIFDGAEVPSNRILLTDMGVRKVGLSFYRLFRRGLPKTKPYLVEDRFPDDVEVYVDSGWSQVPSSGMTDAETEDYAADYQDFVGNNLGRISGATELWLPGMSHDWNMRQRDLFWSELEHLFWPVWSGGHPELFALAERYEHVAIPHSLIEADTTLAARVNALVVQHQTSFHGLGVAKPDNLRSIRFDTASTLSWLSPMRRGETIVWDGSRLVRYPQRMKDQARMRYSATCERAGLDFSKVLDDDPNEVTRLAIWSYLQMELAMSIGSPFDDSSDEVVASSPDRDGGQIAEGTPADVAKRAPEARKALEPREPSETGTLPVFGVQHRTIVDTDEHGNQVLREVPVLESQSTSLRQCDTCFVAATCPAFKAGSACAFNLPVEVRTKDQLRSLLNAIIEMQGQRVAFSRFSEELNGGYPDPNTGQEIDRLFKLVKTLKELEDNREFIRITAERQSAGGVLSALFGDRAASLRDLPDGGLDAQQTNRVIDGSLGG